MLFVVEYETFVEARFKQWVQKKTKGRRFLKVPAPAALLTELRDVYGLDAARVIDPSLTLNADLIKKIRNLYAHRGYAGIPRSVDDQQLLEWQNVVSRIDPVRYSDERTADAIRHVIGAAVAKSRAAAVEGKNLKEEFFYALFTFTNIRNFVSALEAGFHGCA